MTNGHCHEQTESACCYSRRLVFHQSLPVHIVSESWGCSLNLTEDKGGKLLNIILDDLALTCSFTRFIKTMLVNTVSYRITERGCHIRSYFSNSRLGGQTTLVYTIHCDGSVHYPILDTRISVRPSVRSFVTLRVPPLDSETGWTGELWSNPVLLILEN